MKVIVKALLAALALVLFAISTASADGRYQGIIVIDGTLCSAEHDPDGPDTLASGTLVSVFPDNVTADEQLIGFGETGTSCWVPKDSVKPWDGEGLNEEPPAEQPELVVIGESRINADGVNCRTAPNLNAGVVTQLVYGEYVVLIADGNDEDDWQWIGHEATTCHVSKQFLGIAAEEPPVIEPVVTETEQEIVQPAPEPEMAEITPEPEIVQDIPESSIVSAEAEIASVTQLPIAGVGNPKDSPLGIIALLILGALVLAGVLFSGWYDKHKEGIKAYCGRVSDARRRACHWFDDPERY